MPAAYLTPQEAQTRLAQYSITGTPTDKELALASDELDLMGGFIGERYDITQPRIFPRSIAVRDDQVGEVPSDILDWIALTAYELQREDQPPVKSARLKLLSETYTRGKRSRIYRVKKNLLRYYRGADSPIRIV